MTLHGLPSLATLRLGATTGMPGTNADGKRPVKASRGEDAEDAEDASPQAQPEMLLLTHLPRDVMGKVVTQAALDARRTSVNPASAICAWMKRFCTSARMQGVLCDEYWYRLALEAFWVDPHSLADQPPNWMRTDAKKPPSWRAFFGAVCNSFLAKPTSFQRIRDHWPELLNHSLTQRQLDETLGSYMSYYCNILVGAKIVLTKKEARDLAKAHWELAMNGRNSPLYSYDFWPLIGLLLLRGAEPWTDDKYVALDHEVYVAIMSTRGDDLSAPERLSTDEAIRRIADAVARGASTVYTVRSLEPRIVAYTLTAALEANNPAIIRWLLDHGAGTGGLGKRVLPKRQYQYLRQLITKTVYDVDEWQADLDTTEELIVNAVWFFDTATAQVNQDPFWEAKNILEMAIDHMEDNGFRDSWDTDGARVKLLIYNSWKSIFDDFYPDPDPDA